MVKIDWILFRLVSINSKIIQKEKLFSAEKK